MCRIVIAAFAIVIGMAEGICQSPAVAAPTDEASRVNRLGLATFSALRAEASGNMVTSPWAAHRALVLLHEGARGDTQREIATAMGGANPLADSTRLRAALQRSVNDWNSKAEVFIRAERGERIEGIAWRDVCAVWLAQGIDIRPEFSAAISRVPNLHARTMDFAGNHGKALVDVNGWISDATGGRLPRMLQPGAFNKDTKAVLTSAVYFKAAWRQQFDVGKTRREPFTVAGGKTATVPTMITGATVGSAVHDDFTVVGLEVSGGGEFQLLLFVPKAADGLAAIEAKITPELLRDCATMKKSRIALYLPRFRVPAVSRAMSKPFAAMGIQSAFDAEKADFSGVSGVPLYVNAASESCEFTVNESGLSGAAANVVISSLFGDPAALPNNSDFRVNRPFAFTLQHIPSTVCLFVGRVTDPR